MDEQVPKVITDIERNPMANQVPIKATPETDEARAYFEKLQKSAAERMRKVVENRKKLKEKKEAQRRMWASMPED